VLRLRMQDVTHSGDLEASNRKLEELIRGSVKSFVIEERYLRPDGSVLWAQADLAAIRDAEGRVHSVTAAITDISERHMLEDALVERAAELGRADRSKDEFLAMLAHELRNPLAPLRNAAEILQTEGTTADECGEAQHIINRQIENMTRMIDDLLDVSRITEGKVELQKHPVALDAILTEVISLARSNCAARHQKLEVSIPTDPIYLNADATRLEQVFSNLLGNACKYSGEGRHISLTAECAAGVDPPEVIVRVRDDGSGIDPVLLPRVFDLFVQATRALDRAHGGLGIGLTLVSRLVKLHGGSVEARSEGLGKGSEFIVHLPTLQKAPPKSALPPPAAREIPRRILIVDDNSDSVRSMAILQTRRGHVVRTASTGPDAVAVAVEFLPEVVLLDIGLPGMDGYEVVRQLRAIPALADAFIVGMSGYGSDEDRANAREVGFDEYMVKPVDLNLLREHLRRGRVTLQNR
jgi:signal transduction histidine kinase/ActR/RegA family two-component response regulator